MNIWEERRKAPMHFWARADNARFSAFVLSQTERNSAKALAETCDYGSSTEIALREGFLRESSIAMELILKALFCSRNKKQPPTNHDIFELWHSLSLPKLSNDQKHRLTRLTEILYWSGRYAAPTSEKHLNRPRQRYAAYQRTEELGNLKVVKPTPLTWEHFDELYSMANSEFWQLN